MGLVQRLIQAQPDAYLTELAEQFTQQTGISVSRVTMHRCIQRLSLSTKKHDTPMSRTVSGCKFCAMSIGAGSTGLTLATLCSWTSRV
ncbi:hypothetical protein ACQ4M4_04645 [Leptolyngbya sp. AN02str]|uniref:hypothetical protein n=1 Tax=Leptolyngbya sp. AN02str TaxID=3423363 RepID=UPI003D317AB7